VEDEFKRSWFSEAILKIVNLCDLDEKQQSIAMQILLLVAALAVLGLDIYALATGQLKGHIPFFIPMILGGMIPYVRYFDKKLAEIDAEQANDPYAKMFRD
jgi:hypothetical protein